MKAIKLIFVASVGASLASPSSSSAAGGKCSSIQARCALEIGGTCDVATGQWRYRGGQQMTAQFDGCLSRMLKSEKADSGPVPSREAKRSGKSDANKALSAATATAQGGSGSSGPVPAAASIPGTISCDALSTSPKNWPAYRTTLILNYVGGSFLGERPVAVGGAGNEVYRGAVNAAGDINLSGHGKRFSGSSSWTLKFDGRFNPSGQTVLRGNLVALKGGRRNCELAIDLEPDVLRSRLALGNISSSSPHPASAGATSLQSSSQTDEYERKLAEAVEAKSQAERNSKQLRDAAEIATKLAEFAQQAKATAEGRAAVVVEQARQAVAQSEKHADTKVAAAEQAKMATEKAAADAKEKQLASDLARQNAERAARDEKLKADRLTALLYVRPTSSITSLDAAQAIKPKMQLDPRTETLKKRVATAIGEDAAARLFDGDPGDILVLLNETTAPHAIRVLSGEIKFQKDLADTCRVGRPEYDQSLDEYLQKEIRKTLPSISFSSFRVTGKVCGTQSDLLIVRREALGQSERLGFDVADAVMQKQLSILMVVPRAPFELLRSSAASLQKGNTTQLLEGALDGFGTIVIPTGDKSVVCVSSSEGRDFIDRVLADMRSSTTFEPRWPERPKVAAATPDELFVASKRGGCGFISGDAGLLQQVLKGLKRDSLVKDADAPFVSSVFLSRQEAEATATAVAQHRRLIAAQAEHDANEQAKRAEEAKRAAQQREIDELRRLQLAKSQDATQRALEETRRKNDELARVEEIKRQRIQVASRGRTIMDGFEARLKKHIVSISKEIKELKRRAAIGDVPSKEEVLKRRLEVQDERLEREFPAWSNWLMDRIKEEWEISDPVLALEDYGTSKWKGRTIEAISVRVEFPMLNRVVGERQKYCVDFVWINDEEFSFYREPKSYQCDLYKGAFQSWSLANQFESRWNVKLQ